MVKPVNGDKGKAAISPLHQITAEAAKLQKIQEDLKRIASEKDSVLSVFGIWAGLIAFIAIEFNFLKTLYSWQEFVGFSLVLSALIFGFSATLEILIRLGKNQEITKAHKFLCGIITLLLVGGFSIAYFGNEHSREKKIDEFAATKFEKGCALIVKSCEQKIDSKVDSIVNSFDKRLEKLDLEIKQIRSDHNAST